MSAVRKLQWITEDDYLQAEDSSDLPNEFVDGQIIAMASPTDTHEILAGNIFSALNQHLRDHPCRPFAGRMKLRMQYLNRTSHYVPDVMVACDKEPRDRRFREHPALLVEVLSPSTEGTDIREKMFAYLTIEDLNHYVIVAQDRVEVTIYRRTQEGWEVEVLTDAADQLRAPDLGFSMSVAEIYRNTRVPGSV